MKQIVDSSILKNFLHIIKIKIKIKINSYKLELSKLMKLKKFKKMKKTAIDCQSMNAMPSK